MQIEIITEGGKGATITLPPEFALDGEELGVEHATVDVPGRHGQLVDERYERLRPRKLTASAEVLGATRSSMASLVETYRGYLLGRGELWLKQDTSDTRFIRVRCERVEIDPHRGHFDGRINRLSLTFQAFSPWWYATTVQAVPHAFVGAAGSAETWTITQPGTSRRQYPVLYIASAGALVNPTITNTTTGHTLTFAGSIPTGKTLIVRTDPPAAWIVDQTEVTLADVQALWGVTSAEDYQEGIPPDGTNALGAINGEALTEGWALAPGANTIMYNDDGTSLRSGTVTVTWRPRFY
jgi:hypothetical protein